MGIFRRAAVAVVLFLLSPGPGCPTLAAQAAEEPPSRWWAAGGVGGGSWKADGAAGLLELVHQRGPHHFALRGLP